MHHYSRPPPPTASPANAEHTDPTRTNNPRDREGQHQRSPSHTGPGFSDDFGNPRQETSTDNSAAQMQRLNQVIQNFHTKAALIVLHSRVELPHAYSTKNNEKRVNRWFNIELDETEAYTEDIRLWRKSDVINNRPPPMVIEIFLTTDTLPQGQRLVILDEDEKRWDVTTALASQTRRGLKSGIHTSEVLLERWTIELGQPVSPMSTAELTSILPLVYKKSIVLFRSLYTYCNFLPAWKLARKVGRSRSNMALKLGYRIVDGSRLQELSRPDTLTTALCDSTTAVATTYSFGETESPAGPFSINVQYRENCDFRIDDSEELLSSRLLGVDEDLFRPSIPSEEQIIDRRQDHHVGSLPIDRRKYLMQRPELGHAYGSLSTFHQAGFGAGTSPISALRSAREFAEPSPSPEPTRPSPQPLVSTGSQKSSLRASAAGRRSSFSIQPFKTPVLSASPLGASPLGTSPRTTSTRVPALEALSEEGGLPAPNAQAVAARKSGSFASDHQIASSAGSSPKPPPNKYSSSFSHRRSKPSFSSTNPKPDDDQISSGRASAASSAAPLGSGLMAEAGGATSSGSMQEDDENISAFLKMLDMQKDLLVPMTAAASEASTKRTAAALNRFHKMRDSNAALSDSMSSSLVVTTKSPGASGRQSTAAPASAASSPSKPPVSPHTPHMPFAPSRLSAAYSHDDDDHRQITEQNQQNIDNTAGDDETDEARASNVPAIDIPCSPRLIKPNYRRSSSAQRRPLSSDEDLGDVFGLRSASMGAPDRTADRPGSVRSHRQPTATEAEVHQITISSRRNPQTHQQDEPTTSTDGTFEQDSVRSSANHIYRSRLARGSGMRGVTPPQGSTSSFGGTGGSLERGDSGGSISGSWGGRGGGFRSGSRPENKFVGDDGDGEEEFLPFAIDKSDFNTGVSGR